jgi:carboxyl-terminal processing protease
MKKIKIIAVLLVFFIGTAAITIDNDKYFEILKNLEIYSNVYKELNTHYVDDLDPNQLMRTGIDAMVNSLDPFTNYISESQVESYRISSEGKYNGVGAVIRKIDNYATIVETYENSPAIQAGLLIGDQIRAISGMSTEGKNNEDVITILRGIPGTEVEITIMRPGESIERNVILDRGEVQIPNVPHSNLVDPDIGYISLTTFTPNAGKNVADALVALKKENPALKGVILDLRNNGGGLLREAIHVSNVFINKGEDVVATKGKVKDRDKAYKAMGTPVDTKIPVVVLINKSSASASEIVSGTLQDLDRAVLMGQRSYGKGLVQNTKEVGYNSRLKVTTSKYYIPSGRCIQSVEYENGEPKEIDDEMRAKFKTKGGRIVLDGGGVSPDIVLEKNDNSALMKAIRKQDMIFKYVTEYVLKHKEIAPAGEFEFADYNDFLAYLNQNNFEYKTASEEKLEELNETASKDNLHSSISIQLEAITKTITLEKEKSIKDNEALILDLIETEIVSRYYYETGKVIQKLENDDEVDQAIALLKDVERYNSILK